MTHPWYPEINQRPTRSALFLFCLSEGVGQGGINLFFICFGQSSNSPLVASFRTDSNNSAGNDCHGLWGGTAELLQMDRNAMLPYSCVMGTLWYRLIWYAPACVRFLLFLRVCFVYMFRRPLSMLIHRLCLFLLEKQMDCRSAVQLAIFIFFCY